MYVRSENLWQGALPRHGRKSQPCPDCSSPGLWSLPHCAVVRAGTRANGTSPALEENVFPLGVATIVHGTSVASWSGGGTQAAMGKVSPVWPLESPGMPESWGSGSRRARSSHVWVLQAGRALWGRAQVSGVSLCPCSTPPTPLSPWLGGSGEPGHGTLQEAWGFGRELLCQGGLRCVPVVIAAPSPSHTRKAAPR